MDNKFVKTGGALERKITFTPQQIAQLEAANQRVSAGTPGGASSTNAGDVKNLEYAKSKGWLPTSTTKVDTGTTAPTGGSGLLPGGTTPTAPTAPQISPVDGFNKILMGMLEKSKGVNADELYKRQRALQRASLGQGSEITPEELRTLSPAQQESIRSGKTQALSPELDEVAYQIKAAETATKNFEDIYDKVTKLSQEYAEKMVAPQSVIESYKKRIEASPESIELILSAVNDKTKDAILQTLDYTKLKPSITPAQELELITDGYVKVSGPSQLAGLTEDDIIRVGNNIYKKPPEKLITKNITVGSGKSAKEYLITYNETGKEIKRELLSGGGGGGGGGDDGIADGITKAQMQAIQNNLQSVVGADNKVSPQDYNAALSDWIRAGGSATTFHSKMAGLRNPDNPYYGVTKTPSNSSTRTP